MKLELQRGLARQLRDNHKRQVQACREEREEARKIEENIRKSMNVRSIERDEDENVMTSIEVNF